MTLVAGVISLFTYFKYIWWPTQVDCTIAQNPLDACSSDEWAFISFFCVELFGHGFQTYAEEICHEATATKPFVR